MSMTFQKELRFARTFISIESIIKNKNRNQVESSLTEGEREPGKGL